MIWCEHFWRAQNYTQIFCEKSENILYTKKTGNIEKEKKVSESAVKIYLLLLSDHDLRALVIRANIFPLRKTFELPHEDVAKVKSTFQKPR